jgi:PIN domain nuclease of toxin-antitoxin system
MRRSAASSGAGPFGRARRAPLAGAGPGVAEAAVTDTHPLLFHAAGNRRLGRRAAAVFDAAERQAALIYVPAAVIWECGLLAWTGRVDLRRPLPQFFAELFSNPAYQPVDLTPAQVYRADSARPNRDPFDALICAAAGHLELPLLTRDGDIRTSGLVRVIW